jgi:hypothetical protein
MNRPSNSRHNNYNVIKEGSVYQSRQWVNGSWVMGHLEGPIAYSGVYSCDRHRLLSSSIKLLFL